MRRKRTTSPVTIIIFIVAAALSLAVSVLLPIPGKFRRLVFFLLVVALSLAGVVIHSKIRK